MSYPQPKYNTPSYIEEAMCSVAPDSVHRWELVDTDDPAKGVRCAACERDAVEILETLIWQATI